MFVAKFVANIPEVNGQGGGESRAEGRIPGSVASLAALCAGWLCSPSEISKTTMKEALVGGSVIFFSAVLERKYRSSSRPQNKNSMGSSCRQFRCANKEDERTERDHKFETLVILSLVTRSFICQGCPRGSLDGDLSSVLWLPHAWLRLRDSGEVEGERGSFLRCITSSFWSLPKRGGASHGFDKLYHATQISHLHHLAPLLVPDVLCGDRAKRGLPWSQADQREYQNASISDRRRIYRRLLGVKSPELKSGEDSPIKAEVATTNYTNRFGCRKYVKGAFHAWRDPSLYSNGVGCKEGSPFFLSPGGPDIVIECHDQSNRGFWTSTVVQVRDLLPEKDFLHKCAEFASAMGTQNCRHGSGDLGRMVVTGKIPFPDGTEHETANLKSSDRLQNAMRNLNTCSQTVLNKHFPEIANEIGHTESVLTKPSSLCGGESAMMHRMVASGNFVCAPHYDSNDGSHSIVCWICPDINHRQTFLFPNVSVEVDGCVFQGLCIPITHGTAVSFDGRLLRHCTSLPGNDTADLIGETIGLFWGAQQRDISCSTSSNSKGNIPCRRNAKKQIKRGGNKRKKLSVS